MWIGETIDLDDHDTVVKFMKNQSDKIKKLEKENEQLKQQVAFLEEFLKSGVQYEYYQKVYDENEQLKQQIKDLYKFVKCDVDNGIDIYPKAILEHLVDILKIIGDVE